MFGKRKKPKHIVTQDEVIATRDVYDLFHEESKHSVELRQRTTEFWHLAGKEAETEIEGDVYACSFDLIRALAQGRGVISLIYLSSYQKDQINRLRKQHYRSTGKLSYEPTNNLNRVLATLYDEHQGLGRLLPCTYGQSFALLSREAPIDAFAQYFKQYWPLNYETHAIWLFEQMFDELSQMTGAQLMEMTDIKLAMLQISFSPELSLIVEYNPEKLSFDRIASAAKEVMTKHNKILEVVEC